MSRRPANFVRLDCPTIEPNRLFYSKMATVAVAAEGSPAESRRHREMARVAFTGGVVVYVSQVLCIRGRGASSPDESGPFSPPSTCDPATCFTCLRDTLTCKASSEESGCRQNPHAWPGVRWPSQFARPGAVACKWLSWRVAAERMCGSRTCLPDPRQHTVRDTVSQASMKSLSIWWNKVFGRFRSGDRRLHSETRVAFCRHASARTSMTTSRFVSDLRSVSIRRIAWHTVE